MARDFDDYMIAMTGAVMDFFGYKSSTYAPESGSPVTLTVFYQIENESQVTGYEFGVPKKVDLIECLKSDIEGLDRNGVFAIGSNSYAIKDVHSQNDHEIKFVVKKV